MNAKIELKSIIDGEELISSNNGSVAFQGDVTLLAYKEVVDDNEIETSIEISDAGVKVEKRGIISSSMNFILGKETDMLYSTPFGDMMMKAMTDNLTFEITDDFCMAEISYKLYNNSALISSHDLKIRAEFL